MPAENAGTSDEGKSTSSCLPLLVFDHKSDQPSHVHDMLMFSVSQKRLLHGADMGPDLVSGSTMCWTTPQGWMLVMSSSPSPSPSPASSPSSSSAESAWLWNPRTGDKIALPDVEAEHGDAIPMACKCLLTHKDVTDPSCFVVLFDYMEPNMWYCKVVGDGGGGGGHRGWRRYTYDVGDYEVPGGDDDPPTKDVVSSIAAVGGEIFFISSAEDMCAITFAPESDEPEFSYFDVAMVDFPEGMCSGRTWLVESDDELFLVCVCFVGFDAGNIGAIDVYKMDFSTEAWCMVRDIGDAVFLLEDANMAACCPASPLGLKANQIYFMKNLSKDDADLCIFDIELGVQEITRVHQYGHLQLYRKPFWILPPS